MSLSTFKRAIATKICADEKTKEPIVLTVNGKAAMVVQDAEGYQSLLDLNERSDVGSVIK